MRNDLSTPIAEVIQTAIMEDILGDDSIIRDYAAENQINVDGISVTETDEGLLVRTSNAEYRVDVRKVWAGA